VCKVVEGKAKMKTIDIGGGLFEGNFSRIRKGIKINYADVDYEKYLGECHGKRAHWHREEQAGASSVGVHLIDCLPSNEVFAAGL